MAASVSTVFDDALFDGYDEGFDAVSPPAEAISTMDQQWARIGQTPWIRRP